MDLIFNSWQNALTLVAVFNARYRCMESAIILLGSNLGQRSQNIDRAVSLLARSAGAIRAFSSVYETQPWGMDSSRWFHNRCVALDTMLEPDALLTVIRDLEKELGRETVGRTEDGLYLDRIIDIDILFYGNRVVSTRRLAIPHPHLKERRFALVPLLEICPDITWPVTGERIEEILETCTDPMEVIRLGP